MNITIISKISTGRSVRELEPHIDFKACVKNKMKLDKERKFEDKANAVLTLRIGYISEGIQGELQLKLPQPNDQTANNADCHLLRHYKLCLRYSLH